MYPRLALSIALAAATLASACAEQSGPTAPTAADGGPALAKRGAAASLSATQTAVGFDETQIDYDWSFSEEVESVMYMKGADMLAEPSRTATTIVPGDIRWVVYRLNATRNDGTRANVTGVRGAVCATNNGGAATQRLTIIQQIQAGGNGAFTTVASQPVDVTAKPLLAAGESHCYPYEMSFARTAGVEYRATPLLTADNGTATAAAASIAFGAHATVTRDASARIDESIIAGCRNGWPSIICTWGDETAPRLPYTVTGTISREIVVDMHNPYVCGETLPIVAHATLTELGPYAPGTAPRVYQATAPLAVHTGDCAPKPSNPGCTLTQGYWKNHAWPEHPLFPPSTLATWDIDHGWDYQGWNFFDTGLRWTQVLDVAPRGDPYYILAHQYIAAILNQQNGAYVPDQVRQTLVDAYTYFSSSPDGRAAYDRNTLTTWANLLDQYNNGQLGVPHCG